MKPSSEIKSSLIVKLNFLLLGLGLTVYFIYVLQTKGMPPAISALFGLQPSPRLAVSPGQDFQWKWCDTRVRSLTLPEGFQLIQEGRNWLVSDPNPRVVDFISVEKWFGQYCAVPAHRVESLPSKDLRPELTVTFVTGESSVLRRGAAGTFFWRGMTFESPAFSQALTELKQLPSGVRR